MTPYCANDITLDWLNQVFTQDEITDFSSEIIGGGVGVLGELARLTLTYNKKSDSPETIVAKFSSPLQETRDAAGSFGFYEMESKFYAELSERLPIKVPRCYYQASEPANQQFVLLMADIRGTVVDQIAGCSLVQAEVAIENLVTLHSWGYQHAPEISWLRNNNNESFLSTVADSVEVNTPTTIEKFSDQVPDWLGKVAPDMHIRIRGYADRIASHSKTFVHGDFRADNLVFDAENNLTTLDWQIILKAPGAYDLGYFLSQSLDVELRRQHGNHLVQCYLDGMSNNDIKIDQDEFDEAFKLTVTNCLVYPLIGGGIMDESFERSRTLISTMLTRACRAVEDYDCLSYL